MLQHFRDAEISDPCQSSDVWLPRANQVRAHGIGFSVDLQANRAGKASQHFRHVSLSLPLAGQGTLQYNRRLPHWTGKYSGLGALNILVSQDWYTHGERKRVARHACRSNAIVVQCICIDMK